MEGEMSSGFWAMRRKPTLADRGDGVYKQRTATHNATQYH